MGLDGADADEQGRGGFLAGRAGGDLAGDPLLGVRQLIAGPGRGDPGQFPADFGL